MHQQDILSKYLTSINIFLPRDSLSERYDHSNLNNARESERNSIRKLKVSEIKHGLLVYLPKIPDSSMFSSHDRFPRMFQVQFQWCQDQRRQGVEREPQTDPCHDQGEEHHRHFILQSTSNRQVLQRCQFFKILALRLTGLFWLLAGLLLSLRFD